MSICEWGSCPNEATKVVTRDATEEERQQSLIKNERGVSWVQIIEKSVCADHLEDARKEYPYIANKMP